MFVGKVCGRAEDAMNFYAEVFKGAPGGAVATGETEVTVFARWGAGQEPEKEGTVQYATFVLNNQEFAAMDSAREHQFAFNEAVSFMVPCDTQQEIDYYWERLSADPKAGQCGWLKDKFGLSWQIVPSMMNDLLGGKDPERLKRVTQAFLKMKKFDIEALKRA